MTGEGSFQVGDFWRYYQKKRVPGLLENIFLSERVDHLILPDDDLFLENFDRIQPIRCLLAT